MPFRKYQVQLLLKHLVLVVRPAHSESLSVSLQDSTIELSPNAGVKQAAKEIAKAKSKAKGSGKKQNNKSKADDAATPSEPKQKKPKTEVMKRPSALRRPAAAVEPDAVAGDAVAGPSAAASPLAWFGASSVRIACRAACFFVFEVNGQVI